MNSVGITHLLNLGKRDIIYVPLPLHHSIGIIAGAGPAMICGIPAVVCRKFSAIRYWMDCIKYKCTVSIMQWYNIKVYLTLYFSLFS